MKEKTETQRREVAEENADTARLDWLILQLAMASDRANEEIFGKPMSANVNEYRPAIDAARGVEKKELGDETPTAREQSNAETGLAPCPFCEKEAYRGSTLQNPRLACCKNPICPIYMVAMTCVQWNKRAPLTPLRSGLLQDALEALDFVCRIWSKPSDPTPSDVKECYEACRIVLARANAEGVSLISSHETKSTVEGEKEKSVWVRTAERAPTKEDADRQGKVLATFGVVTVTTDWEFVGKYHYDFWMPIPALPDKGGGVKVL